MKGYSKAPGLEPHHHMILCYIWKLIGWGILSLCRDAVIVFFNFSPLGLNLFGVEWKLDLIIKVASSKMFGTPFSTLTFEAETWTECHEQIKKHHTYKMNTEWKDKVTKIDILRWEGLLFIEDILKQKNLSWLEHI